MLNSYFEDFLVQSDLELFSALDLNSVLVDQHMTNFEFSIDQRTFKTSSSSSPSSAYNYYYRYNTHGGEEFKLRDVKLTRFIITRRAPAKESLATPYEIWRAMTEFWRDLTKPTGKQLSDFIFNLAAFDIEVGYTCSLKQRRSNETDTESEEKIPNTIPTFINGFCQCICFRTADYSGYIDVNSMTTYQFVYIPPNIDRFACCAVDNTCRVYRLIFFFKKKVHRFYPCGRSVLATRGSGFGKITVWYFAMKKK